MGAGSTGLPGALPRVPDRTEAGPGGPEWRALERRIEDCRACRLGDLRTQVVVYRGPARPRVVLVGEAPGAEEDRAGRPFVGRAGRRLDEALAAAGVTVGALGYLNLIKCRPPGNRFDPGAARACRPFLEEQLRRLRPRLLVPLGARALAALDPSAPTITRAAGRPRSGGRPPLFPLLHPAAPLHDPRLRERWQRDLNALAEYVRARPRPTS